MTPRDSAATLGADAVLTAQNGRQRARTDPEVHVAQRRISIAVQAEGADLGG